MIAGGEAGFETDIENVRVAVWSGLELSLTVTVKEKLPGLVGAPLNTPAEERVKPFGIPVVGGVHVYGGVPPVAVSDREYEVPTTADGSGDGVVIVSAVPVTTMRKSAVAVCVGLPACA